MRRPAQYIAQFIVIVLLASRLTAAEALDSDKYEDMHIISNTATYDRDQSVIIYEGNVQANQGSSHLDGHKIVLYQMPNDKNKIEKIIAYGKPAHYNTLPNPHKARLYVEALTITYDPNKKTVLLEENALVNQDGNVFSGPHIWYDMANGVVHSLTNSRNERTEMIIQPQKQVSKK